MKDRKNRILEILTKTKRAEVAELSEALGVSQVTIRKDLDRMAAEGLIAREHGFAVLNNEDDISMRLAFHYEQKQKIGLRASELVREGDTIMIESGSCCALLAMELAKKHRSLTVVTNSAFIADHIRNNTEFQIVLTGGIYQKDTQCLVGPMVRAGAENYNVEYFFIGTDGYSPRTGFANKDQLRAQAVRDMAEFAEKIVVVTESSKFESKGTVPLRLGRQPQIVITDDALPEETQTLLSEEGIEVIRV